MNGYIVKGIGGFYYVKTPDGIVECKPRGIFRKQKITPVAGDEVTLETENGASVIAQIAPRKNVFVRPPVANLDVLFLVASTTQPTPSTLVLDKLSAIAVDKGVQRRSKSRSSSYENASNKLSILTAWVTLVKRPLGVPPTFWVGEVGVISCGNCASNAFSSRVNASYSKSSSSGASWS